MSDEQRNEAVRQEQRETPDPPESGEDKTASVEPGSVIPAAEAVDPEPESQAPAAVQARKAEAGSASPEREPPNVQRGEARPVDPARADDVLSKRMPGSAAVNGHREADKRNAETNAADAAVLADSRRRTRRSFLAGGAAAAAGVGFYTWLNVEHEDEMQPGVLRRAFLLDAAVARGIARDDVLTPTYPLGRAETLRVNGVYGLNRTLVPDSWRLQFGVQGAAGRSRFVTDVTAWEYRYTDTATTEDPGHDTKVDPKTIADQNTARKMAPEPMVEEAAAEEDDNHTGRKPRGMGEAGESDSTLPPNTPGLLLTMDDILRFPRRELVTQFKCIEGWSQIVHWAGIRLADLLEAYPPEPIDGKEPKYVYMETPDGDYYTGYDLHVCRHPQTLLVTEMMGAPLTQFHGAPLRLHMPTKYGYKQIKRIGLIRYTNDKPDDYWTKLGYDWYAGL